MGETVCAALGQLRSYGFGRANPAINLARSLSNTFPDIAPHDELPFIAAQLLGAGRAALVARWLFDPR